MYRFKLLIATRCSNIYQFNMIGEAYLAQSPQLYKQMCICADFERVFEIAPGNLQSCLKDNHSFVDVILIFMYYD